MAGIRVGPGLQGRIERALERLRAGFVLFALLLLRYGLLLSERRTLRGDIRVPLKVKLIQHTQSRVHTALRRLRQIDLDRLDLFVTPRPRRRFEKSFELRSLIARCEFGGFDGRLLTRLESLHERRVA